MKILILGGTRFVGKALVSKLNSVGNEITLFTRGNNPIPRNVEHIKGDRQNLNDLRLLANREFDVVADISGRQLEDTKKIFEHLPIPKSRFIYMSSAGVYSDSETFPVDENHKIDITSRHIGKANTEKWLVSEGIPFTSFRPTYIYGPGNYNPIERWFFDRIVHNQPIPIPSNIETITQLGHVSDLAEAITKSLNHDICINRIYNCSGKKAVTFTGILKAACKAVGKDFSELTIKYFDPALLEPKQRKLFPLRLSNFFTDISRIEKEIDWHESIDLEVGMLDSYKNDYLNNQQKTCDFSNDKKLVSF